jgi:NAD(P)-dependent dehydrogenase (short-subunit alcohol dehydrogenase family)
MPYGEQMSLEGKNIIVTGGTRGLGEAVVRRLVSRGARVGIVYLRSNDRAERLRESYPGLVIPLQADVRDEAAVGRCFRNFSESTGRLDGLVNNAGVASMRLLVLARDSEPVRAMIDTNLLGAIFCCRAALNIMWRQHGGSIVNVGSIAAVRPSAGQAVYAATKGAIVTLTQALAVECGQVGIRVNCVSPGPVRTEMLENIAGTSVERYA